jgi:hypothetical protein
MASPMLTRPKRRARKSRTLFMADFSTCHKYNQPIEGISTFLEKNALIDGNLPAI